MTYANSLPRKGGGWSNQPAGDHSPQSAFQASPHWRHAVHGDRTPGNRFGCATRSASERCSGESTVYSARREADLVMTSTGQLGPDAQKGTLEVPWSSAPDRLGAIGRSPATILDTHESLSLHLAAMKTCPACQQDVALNKRVCPHCGHRFISAIVWVGFLFTVFVLLMCALMFLTRGK
jgi:hypothetical protein